MSPAMSSDGGAFSCKGRARSALLKTVHLPARNVFGWLREYANGVDIPASNFHSWYSAQRPAEPGAPSLYEIINPNRAYC